MTKPQKLPLLFQVFVFFTLLAFSSIGGTAYCQNAVTVPTFFTTTQHQTFEQRTELEPGSLAYCTVPKVTITHSPGYVVPTTPPRTIYADLVATPHATCNDGTPAAFLFKPGFGAAANRWVIYLQGGGQCDNQTECMSRQSEHLQLVSTQPFSSGTKIIAQLTGIMSPDPMQNPDFYDANLVQIAYCSSDFWMGDKNGNRSMSSEQILASDNVANWYFNGHGIVQGVILLLEKSYGLNNASDVLLAGGSAGAVGVFMNASYVAGLLPLKTRFVALPDSYYALSSYPDYNPATGGDAPPPTNSQINTADGQSLWGSVGDFGCAWASRQAGGAVNTIACDNPDVLAKNSTYRIPLFIRESYHDATLLSDYNITYPETTEEELYTNNFDDAMEQSLTSTNVWLSVYGLNNYTHTMIKTTADFSQQTSTFAGTGTLALSAAIGIWYRNPCAAPRWMQRSTLD